MNDDKRFFRGFRGCAWAGAHALVFAVTACGGAAPAPRTAIASTASAPAPQRAVAPDAGWLPYGHAGGVACPAESLGDETESDPAYSLHPGDHVLALAEPQQRVAGEQQAAESLGVYPEVGQPSFKLLTGEVRLAIEEGRGDPRHVVALRQAATGYCVVGVWMTAFTVQGHPAGADGSQVAARSHWIAPDRSWMLVLVETIGYARVFDVGEERDRPGAEERGWAVLGTDGMRLWVAGTDRLDRYLKPAFRMSDGEVQIVDEDTGPHHEVRRLVVDVDGQLVFASG